MGRWGAGPMLLALLAAVACGGGASATGDSGSDPAYDAHIADARELDSRLGRAMDALLPIDAVVHDASTAPVDGRMITLPESAALGMNDISFLLALPADPVNTTTFARMTGFGANGDLIPRNVYTQMIAAAGEVTAPFEQYHVVAIRFDLCDRGAVGPCAVGADGQVRLSFQPLDATVPTRAADVGLHATYRIPTVDMPYVVNELRALARLRGSARAEPLRINPLLSATATPTEYSTRLRDLVAAFAVPARLIRLTVFAQPANQPPFMWHFSGLEPINGSLQYVPIPGLNISSLEQEVVPTNTTSYTTSPIADNPPHFVAGMDHGVFVGLSKADQDLTLQALTSVLDPTATTIKTVMCSGCHMATFLTVTRAGEAHVPVKNIAGRFTSTHDLSIAAGQSATDNLSLRMFGYREDVPEISQRVANDTAMIVDELEARFPPAVP